MLQSHREVDPRALPFQPTADEVTPFRNSDGETLETSILDIGKMSKKEMKKLAKMRRIAAREQASVPTSILYDEIIIPRVEDELVGETLW